MIVCSFRMSENNLESKDLEESRLLFENFYSSYDSVTDGHYDPP